jgi:hypothetical protein
VFVETIVLLLSLLYLSVLLRARVHVSCHIMVKLNFKFLSLLMLFIDSFFFTKAEKLQWYACYNISHVS